MFCCWSLLIGILFYVSFGSASVVYNVDPYSISVSGLSSGGAMAIQVHVTYSESFIGVASYAGLIYRCAQGSLTKATTDCMYIPSEVDVDDMIADADQYEADGLVDPLSGLDGSNVYIFHGTADWTVNQGQADLINEFYLHYNADTIVDQSIGAGHGMPTLDYGIACGLSLPPNILRCDYLAAYHGLNHIYDNSLVEPEADIPILGQFHEFDQSQFEGGKHMDDYGYIYFPSQCTEGQLCKLHFVFHGCSQSRDDLGDEYARNAGYLEVGEANNIIMVFPQAKNSLIDNPNSCWDWWGYDGAQYANNEGVQMMAVKSMLDYLLETSHDPTPTDPTAPPPSTTPHTTTTVTPKPDPGFTEAPELPPGWCHCWCPCSK